MISSTTVFCLIVKLVVIIAEPFKITQNPNYQVGYQNSKIIQNFVTTKSYPWPSGYYSTQSYSVGKSYSSGRAYPIGQFYSTPKPYSAAQIYSTQRSYTTTQSKCKVFGICGTPTHTARSTSTSSKFRTEYEWKLLDFDYENPSDRENDIKRKIFIPGKPAPVDVDVHYNLQGKRVFVTIPRFLPGVPATLGTVTTSKVTEQPVIKPYPSWKWHRYPEHCRKDRIISVYRIKIDQCGRLWVLDTGRLSTERICPMQILAFDLRTDKLIHRKEIPNSVLHEN
ncbi:Major royal jelly protein [Popillia japonica]|uniref:Major royal jelly protein n=1 Tax=Popillia japonica TaxID=7064 RepID=A0AAW1HWK1_POPJA